MSRILLYTDTSSAFLWHFAVLHASRELLERHHIKFAPFLRQLMHHPVTEHAQWESYAPQDLRQMQEYLDSGNDVLLFSRVRNLARQQRLAKQIQEDPMLARHAVNVLFVVGNPVSFHEQLWRCFPRFFKMPEFSAGNYGGQAELMEWLQCTWGKEHVALLATDTQSPAVFDQTDMTPRIFRALGFPAPVLPQKLPHSPAFLHSREGISLHHALEVRSNAWPALDISATQHILRELERDWERSRPFCPLNFRRELLAQTEEDMRRVAAFMGIDANQLACPEWLATEPEIPAAEPLLPSRVKAFASALPPALSEPLRQRLANDLPLLTADQQQLASALAVGGGVEVSRVGEPQPPLTLTVLTMAYNQEQYIAQCMDSVLAQQTNFPVRHIVLDHGSTDGTAAVIAGYAAKHASIQPVFSEHLQEENVRGLFLRCRSTYAALCDGDDYFTDPHKLQRQVDFLESRPHCALCFHPVLMVWDDKSQPPAVFPPVTMLPRGIRQEYYLADLLKANIIQTNSVVYRWRFRDGLPDWFQANLCPGDWYWHLLHAEMGKIGFLPGIMAVYRRHTSSLYNLSFINPVEHRRKHGMAELLTYQAVNKHFHGRYAARLATLASGVLADFLQIYNEEGDDTLFNEACRLAPEFAVPFLRQVNDFQRSPDAPTEGA